MTRETKIGLLVGLAFIIVVGILLSEHITGTTEKPAAALAEAGQSVRRGVSTPGVNTTNLDPVAPVPSSRDMNRDMAPAHPAPGSNDVSVGPGGNQPPIVISNNNGGRQFQMQPQDNGNGTVTVGVQNGSRQEGSPQNPLTQGNSGSEPPIRTATPNNNGSKNNDLNTVAQQHGEPLIPVNGSGNNASNGNANSGNNATVNVREYTAKPGDTLSRIASLLPGGNTKANREAIVKLNVTLQKDPNKIVAGRLYQLPSDAKAVADTNSAPSHTPETPANTNNTSTVSSNTTSTATAERTYTVKKGDTLTKIATEQLGSASEVKTIKDLNSDLLKGTDNIRPDMKLKLPAKQVARND